MEEEGGVESNLFAIMKYAKPEWMYILLGLIGSLVKGCVFPAFSLFFTEILDVRVPFTVYFFFQIWHQLGVTYNCY